MKKRIKIELISDLCAGSGQSLGSLIDNDICFDNYGLAYIPSKRLKGLLKEAFIEYYNWIDDEEELKKLDKIRNNLFGIEGNNDSGNLKIDNAYLNNIESIKNDIENVEEKYKKYLEKHRVANSNTYVRSQTAVNNETGTAKNNSLRFTRVLESGTVFYSNIEFETEDELEILSKCVKLIGHMGTNRTRGYGEVSWSVVDKEEKEIEDLNYDFKDESNYKIKILLRAESNIMVSKQNSEISIDFIPGSNIMGAIANKYIQDKKITDFYNLTKEYQDLFLNGEVKYSNAYITDKKGRVEYYPVPLSFSKVKNKTDKYHNKMFDVNEKDIQLSSISNKYVSLDENNYIKSVDQSESYHHQRAKDLSFGHVSSKADGGSFYQFTSIDMDQYFIANIEAKGKYAKQILKYIRIDEILRVGKSRTAEYGKLLIKDVQIKESNQNTKAYKKFAVILTSPVILFDKQKVKVANDKGSLIKALNELFETENLNVTKSFIGYSDESGYNAIWNLPKEQLTSYEKGTTICFEANEPINLKEDYTLGLRQNEGYGKIKIYNIPENGTSDLYLKEYVIDEKERIVYNNLQQETKNLILKSIKRVIMEEIQENAFEQIEKNRIRVNNSTIGRVLLMLQESATIDDFINNIESIKDLKKLKNVLGLIKNKDNVYNIPAYKDYTNIFKLNNINVPENDNTSFVFEYTKQLFTILRIKGGR